MHLPFVSGEQMRDGLAFGPLVEHLRSAHRQPPPAVERVLMSQGDGGGDDNHYLVPPGWIHDEAMGIKITTVFPGNPSRPARRPAVQALYVLIDGADGTPIALLDGTEMTYWKTAADSTLGADYLARRDAGTL